MLFIYERLSVLLKISHSNILHDYCVINQDACLLTMKGLYKMLLQPTGNDVHYWRTQEHLVRTLKYVSSCFHDNKDVRSIKNTPSKATYHKFITTLHL